MHLFNFNWALIFKNIQKIVHLDPGACFNLHNKANKAQYCAQITNQAQELKTLYREYINIASCRTHHNCRRCSLGFITNAARTGEDDKDDTHK